MMRKSSIERIVIFMCQGTSDINNECVILFRDETKQLKNDSIHIITDMNISSLPKFKNFVTTSIRIPNRMVSPLFTITIQFTDAHTCFKLMYQTPNIETMKSKLLLAIETNIMNLE